MTAICSEITRFPRIVSGIQALVGGPMPQDNRLLAALPEDAREQLRVRLQRVWLPVGHSLHEVGDCMRHVYFPIDAIVSLSTAMDDGTSTEIAAVGNEGLIGLAVIMGGESTHTRAVVTDAGAAFCIGRGNLMELFHENMAAQQLILRYAQAHLTQVGQLAACNRRHSVEQQFCRWLLMRLDRCDSSCLSATHETIANMLGVRRETISQVAGRLQKLEVIRYQRKRIEVIDRYQLEHLSCECYAVVRKETDRLLPQVANVPRSAATRSVPPRWSDAAARSGAQAWNARPVGAV